MKLWINARLASRTSTAIKTKLIIYSIALATMTKNS